MFFFEILSYGFMIMITYSCGVVVFVSLQSRTLGVASQHLGLWASEPQANISMSVPLMSYGLLDRDSSGRVIVP